MRKLFVLLCTVFIVAGCSKDEQNGPSTNCSLSGFSFTTKENPSLSVNANAFSANYSTFYLTVDQGVDLTSLIPTFNIDEKAVATIDGKVIENKVTPVDFSRTQKITVTAESGDKLTYTILCKNGRMDVDILIYAFMADYNIPGVSVSVAKDEELIYSYGYGFADKDAEERVLPTHLFRLASMSKQHTALCIMKLYEEGKLKLSDRVFGSGGILESEFGTDGLVNGATSVTVEHLLRHTSGWVSDPDPMFTSNANYAGKSLDERIRYVIKNVNQSTPPGARYSYYNLGFGILGRIVEKLSGKDFETYLKEEIHAKAGVSDIHVGGDRSQRRPNEVVYYSQDGTNGYGNDMEVIKAAGGIIASTPELMKLMCHIDYGNKVPDILKKETLDLMYSPSAVTPNYGLGWRMNHSIFTEWASYHTGNLAGTATVWERGANGVHAVVLCNSRSYADDFDAALNILLHDIQSKFD